MRISRHDRTLRSALALTLIAGAMTREAAAQQAASSVVSSVGSPAAHADAGADASADSIADASAVAATAAAGTGAASIWDGLSLFAGLDGSKQPQDLGINANMGVRLSANLGVPLSNRLGLEAQAGIGFNASDAAVHVLDQIEGTSRRTQTFVTLGLSQRAGQRVSWAFAYDLLAQQYYDNATLSQVRGSAGYDLSPANEVGVWLTKRATGADARMGDTPVRLDPISQVNAYYTHTWPTGARTRAWAGVAAGHHSIVWVLPDNPRDRRVLVYGADLEMPLSNRFAVSGTANFLTPTATGTVDAFLGLTFYPTGRGRGAAARSPRLGVANNPTFAVNMSR